jgi:hypothetical protein
MPTISTLVRRLAAPFFFLALVGCTDPTKMVDTLPRKAVSGNVTLDGQPLAQGRIQFEPIEASQGTTVLASADIMDGKYAIDRAMGPVPGKYKVSISSRPPIKLDPNEPPGPAPKPEPEKVPAEFNAKTTLTKEVVGEGENVFDFSLKSN